MFLLGSQKNILVGDKAVCFDDTRVVDDVVNDGSTDLIDIEISSKNACIQPVCVNSPKPAPSYLPDASISKSP